jgi:hypothetical protein
MNVVPLRASTEASGPVQCVGRLVSVSADGLFNVEAEDGASWECRRAASCLLQPQLGDTVLLSGPDGRRVYLIAVIEQVDTSVSHIEVPGDLRLTAAAGAVSINSAADLRLQSAACLEMKSSQWALVADRAHCQLTDMRYTGQSLDATVGRLRLVGKVFESVAERVVQMARSALRLVDEVDQVRAGHLDIRAEQTALVHGKHVLLTGKELMKVDAGQIHMG